MTGEEKVHGSNKISRKECPRALLWPSASVQRLTIEPSLQPALQGLLYGVADFKTAEDHQRL